MKIRFCMLEQGYNAENNPQGHPQKVMADLGVKYEQAEAHPIADCWVFRGCTNIPDVLPPCVKASN